MPSETSPIAAALSQDDAEHWLAPLYNQGEYPADYSDDVFKEQFFASRHNREELIELAVNYQRIAEACLSDNSLFKILTSSLHNILKICNAHESIAMKFVSDPALYNMLRPHPFIFYQLADRWPAVCKAILKSAELCQLLTGEQIYQLKTKYGIAILGEAHWLTDVTEKYRAFQSLMPYFKGQKIINFSFPEFKQLFFKAKCDSHHLALIMSNHSQLAEACLKNPELSSLLIDHPYDLKIIGSSNSSLALKILDQKQFSETLIANPPVLQHFAKRSFSACEMILGNPAFRITLTPKQLYNLVAVHGFKAAVLIKDIPELHRPMEEYVLYSKTFHSSANQQMIADIVYRGEHNGQSFYRMGEAFFNLNVTHNKQIAMSYFLKAACAASVNNDPEGIKLALDGALLAHGLINNGIEKSFAFAGIDALLFEAASFLTLNEINTLFPALLNYMYEKQQQTLHAQFEEAYLAKAKSAKAKKSIVSASAAEISELERQEVEKNLRKPRYVFARYNLGLPFLLRAMMKGDGDAQRTFLNALSHIFSSGLPADEICQIVLCYWHQLNNHKGNYDNELRVLIKKINALPSQYTSIRSEFIHTLFSEAFIKQVEKNNVTALDAHKDSFNKKMDAIQHHHQRAQAQRTRFGIAIDQIYAYGKSLQISNPEVSTVILTVSHHLKATYDKHYASDTFTMANPDQKLKDQLFNIVKTGFKDAFNNSTISNNIISSQQQTLGQQAQNYILSLLLDALVGLANTTGLTFFVPAKLTETRFTQLTKEFAHCPITPVASPAA